MAERARQRAEVRGLMADPENPTTDWEPPGPEPIWPFGETDCPLRRNH